MLLGGILKALLGSALLAGLVLVWSNRQPVVDAYRLDVGQERPELRLAGLDLDVELDPLPASPYLVDPAPDTRLALTSATPGEPTAVAGAEPPLWGGKALLGGTVVGPEGPVEGATVRLERHTTGGMAVADVVTDATGAWEARGVNGGRYRVRAWVTDLYTMGGSELLFLGADEAASLDLTIGPVDPGPHLSFTYRGDLYLGHTGTVAVSVTTSTVGDDGVVAISGVPSALVSLAPSPGLVAVPGQVVAGADGVALFQLRCDQVGPGFGVVQHGNRRATFVLPTCVEVPVAQPQPLPESGPDSDASSEGGADSEAVVEPAPPPPPPPPVHQEGVIEIVTPAPDSAGGPDDGGSDHGAAASADAVSGDSSADGGGS